MKMIPDQFICPPFHTIDDICGLHVTVMGLGLNGGGLASARFFAEHGAVVTVTDMKTPEDLAPSIEKLSGLPIRFVLGKHDIADFSSADIVIKNPGVKWENNQYLAAAKCIETDISVFLRLSSAPIIAVTGSKGKSSTVSAIHWGLLQAGYTAFLGGNITVSPLSFWEETNTTTPVVLELSSWQLADLRGRGILRPRIAILTPVMPDHQNWYHGMEPYVQDKELLFADQDNACFTVCNCDDEWGNRFAQKTHGRIFRYSSHQLPDNIPGVWIAENGSGMLKKETGETIEILPAAITVPGYHQKQNLLNAALALYLTGVDPKKVHKLLPPFPGIPHRLQFVAEINGVKFYNDSAATIPEAAAAALAAFTQPVILCAGGTDKELNFEPLAAQAHCAKRLYLLAGSGTDKLIPLLQQRTIPYFGPYHTLQDMVSAATAAARHGDIVVFSPGATSFGMFKNEFDRGNRYCECVTALQATACP